MLGDRLVSTLEQSLRQTKTARHRLLGRLEEIESEAEKLRSEIRAMENSAEQTESAIISLLEAREANGKNRNLEESRQPNIDEDEIAPNFDEYDGKNQSKSSGKLKLLLFGVGIGLAAIFISKNLTANDKSENERKKSAKPENQ